MNRQVCGNHALLQCLAEGTLTADEAAEVKAHVAACPSLPARAGRNIQAKHVGPGASSGDRPGRPNSRIRIKY